MIHSINTSLFSSKCAAWVNPINAAGVMGAGLALEFKTRFPAMFTAYVKACAEYKRLGCNLCVLAHKTDVATPEHILCAVTKRHWKDASTMPLISKAAESLAWYVAEKRIPSIAIPALGCGLGSLDWAQVRPIIVRAFEGVACDVDLYPPR